MSLTRKEVSDIVIGVIAEQLGKTRDEVTSDTRILEDLEGDSLDAVEIVLQIEDELGVFIPDEQATALKTPGQVVEYLLEHHANEMKIPS